VTFAQAIAFLERYPDAHPSPVSLERAESSLNVFTVHDTPNTCQVLRDYLGGRACYVDGGTPVRLSAPADEGGPAYLSPHLLRAWLGPVPVVLPDGCSADENGERSCECNGAHIIDLGDDGLMVDCSGMSAASVTYITPATLHWLRTGEVLP